MSELPKITIITANPCVRQQTLSFDAKGPPSVEEDVLNVSKFFNESLKTVTTPLVGFLGPNHNFSNEDSLAKIVKLLTDQSIKSIYTDSILQPAGIIQYLPSYSTSLISENFLINTPLFMQSNHR